MAEQQLLQHEGSPKCSSPAAPDTVSAAVGAPAVEEPCSNGCADASWQDVTMQVPVCLQPKPAWCTHHLTCNQSEPCCGTHTAVGGG